MRLGFPALGVQALVLSLFVLIGCEPAAKSPAETKAKSGDSSKDKDSSKSASNELVKPAEEPKSPATIHFTEVTKEMGIVFKHVSGDSAEKHFPAANSSGVAAIDIDNDDWYDLVFLTCRLMPFANGSQGPQNRVFRNRFGKKFEEVSSASQLDFSRFCHGVTQGDFNHDGFVDLAISKYRGTEIHLNQGDGSFRQLKSAGEPGWGSSLVAFDADGDGFTDLYVSHYGIWTIEKNEWCGSQSVRTFCAPSRIPPTWHAFLHNNGDGTFAETTKQVGMTRTDGRGQGVVACDLDVDGDVDVYVANDQTDNFLYVNNGKGQFNETGIPAGVGANRMGGNYAGMGVDACDANGDGLPELTVTNFQGEHSTFFLNETKPSPKDPKESIMMFREAAQRVKIQAKSGESVNWGTRFVDFDNDFWPDIFLVAGHVDYNISETNPNQQHRSFPKIWKSINGKYFEFLNTAGKFFDTRRVARGMATLDFDNDGWTEFAVNHVDSEAVLVHNTSPGRSTNPTPAITLTLVGTVSERLPIGTVITVTDPKLPMQVLRRQLVGGASYLSTHDDRITIGIGNLLQVAKINVRFPSGKQVNLEGVKAGSRLTVVEPAN